MQIAKVDPPVSVVANRGVVPADTLRMFPELAASLGGDADALLAGAGIDPARLATRDAAISLRAMCELLESAQATLDCPDFGMRLAAAQQGVKTVNLFELVMRNSPTVGAAFHYCAGHVETYSGAMAIALAETGKGQRSFLSFDILLSSASGLRQATEQMLLRSYNIATDISGGRVRPAEVWFSHEPLAPLAVYRQHFGALVRFRRPTNGFFFEAGDLAVAVAAADPQIHDIATFFIENQYPAQTLPISTRVRRLVSRLIHLEDCTSDTVAASLGLHRRTLQRRLRDEDTCFETIKDEVRREMALRCLGQADISLSRVAEMLGYSEVSALSRSCHRWFAASPRRLRKELAGWRPAIAA